LQCDKHVVKMALESVQILSTVAWKIKEANPMDYLGLNMDLIYKPTHHNHPCVLWAGESVNNFRWLIDHTYGLVDEYRARYKKHHAAEKVCDVISSSEIYTFMPKAEHISPFVLVMPEIYKSINCAPTIEVNKYRIFYAREKGSFARWWKDRSAPAWFDYYKNISDKCSTTEEYIKSIFDEDKYVSIG